MTVTKIKNDNEICDYTISTCDGLVWQCLCTRFTRFRDMGETYSLFFKEDVKLPMV